MRVHMMAGAITWYYGQMAESEGFLHVLVE
jgi:hypothetical protein